jgi:hypothetical protein
MPAKGGHPVITNVSDYWVPAFAWTTIRCYAASAFAGLSGGVIAPDVSMSASSFAE